MTDQLETPNVTPDAPTPPQITGDTVPRPRLSRLAIAAALIVLASPLAFGLLGGQSYTSLICLSLAVVGGVLSGFAWRRISDNESRLRGQRLAAVTMVATLCTVGVLLLISRAHASVTSGWCQKNQMELNMALIMYMQDYGRLPMDWPAVRNYTDTKMPKDRDLRWTCPARFWLDPRPAQGGYGFNAVLTGQSLSTVHDPNTLLLTADALPADGMICTAADLDRARHGSGCWASFADGTMGFIRRIDRVRLQP